MAGRYSPLQSLQCERKLAAGSHRRSAWYALQDAVAESRTRECTPFSPLALLRAAARRRRVLWFKDGMGARKLFCAVTGAGADRIRVGPSKLAFLGRRRASRMPRTRRHL